MTRINDVSERLTCLDINQSFIVQAPAGSGKTELLTQRFLRLLACVLTPENIIAITFTRKASGEMRERIIHALQNADQEKEPEAEHAKLTWKLAKAALANDKKLDWKLLKNPNRLRILTLDSLALLLSQQMPVTSGFGAKPKICEDARFFYETAVERFITREQNEQITASMDRLLRNFDNQADLVKRLLVQLLEKREQWLAYIVPFLKDNDTLKKHLESSLVAVNTDILAQLLKAWPQNNLDEWHSLLYYSLSQSEDPSIKALCICYPKILSTDPSHLPYWKVLVNLILTQQNTVRKQLTKKQGFPSPSSFSKHEAEKHANYKMRGLICLEELANNNNLVLALTTLKHAPPLQFDADTWESLSDLIDLLPWLVAELNCIFQRTGQIDFNELTLGALRALGSDEQPTELAMKLDYQILHLLIDEFQDTSILQADLIRKIISEWQPGDGRSLFVVGDPMQSIYRFRNAEVSLFMQAQEIGIGHIPLKAISLSSNFRSDASLIDWVNTTFKHIFPRTPQQSIGGVPYSHAVAVRCDNNKTAGVSFLKPVSHTQEEALTIAEHIHHLRKDSPTDSIAILVRTRHQLKKLIPTLQKNGISFKATEIDYLGERREIQDLLVLTKALLHLADKTAWLALLRSPFLGFNLADCLAIAEESIGNIIWPAIKTAAISEEADARRQVVLPLLTHALKHIRRCRLSNWVAQTWQALGGRHTLTSSNELNNVRRFFDCLSQHEDDYNQKRFEQSLQKLFAEDHHTAENPVLVMTIHKSKGLEFDHVILPNINYGKSPQDSDLLIWSTISFTHGHTGLLLGILPSKKKNCQIYEYLRYLHTQQLNQETSRLFYVASTRAKKSLQLSTVSAHKSARSGSFMEKLGLELANENGTPEISAIKLKSNNQRIPLKKFTELTRPSNLPTIGCNNTISLHLAFLQSILGSVIHAYLHDLSLNKSWSDEQLSCALIRHGLPKRFLTTYIQTIKIEIQKILLDEKARWILSDKHKDAKSEYSLSEITPIGLRTHVVDRTFIDRGVRYIIDYKTSSPMGTSLYAFVNSELAHHESQLKRYETLFSDGSEPVISGLYFTNLQLWVPRVLE